MSLIGSAAWAGSIKKPVSSLGTITFDLELYDLLDADAVAYFEAGEITDAAKKTIINQAIVDLKAGGFWDKIEACYLFKGVPNTAHKFNLKSPVDADANHRLTFHGTLTRDLTGVQGDGTTGYIKTNINPSVDMTINNSGLSFFNVNNAAAVGNMRDFGAFQLGDNPCMSLTSKDASSAKADQYNYNHRISVSGLSREGFYTTNRTSSTVHKLFRNGVQIGSTETTANVANPPNAMLVLLNVGISTTGTPDSGGYSDAKCVFAAAHEGFSDAEGADFNTIIQTLITDLS